MCTIQKKKKKFKVATCAIIHHSFKLCLLFILRTIPKQKLTIAFMIWAKNSKFAVGHSAIAVRTVQKCAILQ